MSKIKVSVYKRMAQDALVTYVKNITKLMTADAQFASADTEVAKLDKLLADYEVALKENLIGGRITTILKNDSKKALIKQINGVAQLVTIIAEGSESVILAAGFDVAKSATQFNELEAPILLDVNNEKATGVATLHFEKVAGGKNYNIEHRIVVEGVPATEWLNGEYATTARHRIKGLECGKYHEFRIRAIGSRGLVSDWSNSVEVLVS
jgi:hypothetical protein